MYQQHQNAVHTHPVIVACAPNKYEKTTTTNGSNIQDICGNISHNTEDITLCITEPCLHPPQNSSYFIATPRTMYIWTNLYIQMITQFEVNK